MDKRENIKSIPIGANDNERKIGLGEDDFSFEDILWLSKASLGLRHLSLKSQAEAEAEKGVKQGDALSLSSMGYLVKDFDLSQLDPLARQYMKGDPTTLPIQVWHLSEEQKKKLTEKYNSGIKEFIAGSVEMDMNKNSNIDSTNGEIVRKVVDKSLGFIFGVFRGANYAFDQESYRQLGKCGKQDVPKENIRGLITLERNDLNEDVFSVEGQLSQESFDYLNSELSKAIFKKVVTGIKNLRVAEEL
jgi:hypothetical protein